MQSSVVAKGLEQILADRIESSASIVANHGKDESFHRPHAPDWVVYPRTNEEVRSIIRLCAEHATPVIPFGVGTSLEGHIAALNGGVCLDMSLMNDILEVNPDDLDCRVQAGVLRQQLNDELRHYGQFFPVDPGANATLGGMTATGASGTNAVRYGTMKENILGLTLVTANGDIIKTGGRSRKSASGYDLTRLICGSEGTLGVVTEIQLKTYGRPEASAVGQCSFASLHDAVTAVIQVIQYGVPVARVELLDDVQMQAVNRYSKTSYPEAHSLFFEFHGSDASVAAQSTTVAEIVSDNNGGEFVWSVKQEEQNQLWQARHDAYYAAMAMRPNVDVWPTDVCVPISRLAKCIVETRRDVDEQGIIAPIVGHVGDGNFHLLLLVNLEDEDELAKARAINDRLIRRALRMGGTCTGEHGIGYGKLDYMAIEHGDSLETMRLIKRAMDPQNIMNPGKVIPS